MRLTNINVGVAPSDTQFFSPLPWGEGRGVRETGMVARVAMTVLRITVIVAILFLNACATTEEQKTLYKRLGGKEEIAAIVDELLKNVMEDKRINKRFAEVNLPRLKQMLVDQICEISEGPCKYNGRTMRSAHAKLKITDADLTAFIDDLIKAMDKLNVGSREQNELLNLLGNMKGNIVGK